MSSFIILLLVISAGLSLIGKHAAQFKEYLAKDQEVNDRTAANKNNSSVKSSC
jgi:hypothetical protein